jgi:hypothetical protein
MTAAPCQWCGGDHDKLCPFIKALEFGPGGVDTLFGPVTRIEFLTHADFKAQPAQDARQAVEDYPKLPEKGV